jgi:hypothetical protein
MDTERFKNTDREDGRKKEIMVPAVPTTLDRRDPYFYAPIGIDFPCFLGFCRGHRDCWPAALHNISQNLEALQCAEFRENLKHARLAIFRISHPYAFEEVVEFCKSDNCDLHCKKALKSLFAIVPNVIRSLPLPSKNPPSVNDEVAMEFTTFIKTMNETLPGPLVSAKDAALFSKVAELEWPD